MRKRIVIVERKNSVLTGNLGQKQVRDEGGRHDKNKALCSNKTRKIPVVRHIFNYVYIVTL